VLLPAMATMVTAGIAGASAATNSVPATGPEAIAAGGQPTAISLKARKNVMSHRTVKLRGHVTPASSRTVLIRVGGRKLRTHTNASGGFKTTWQAPSSGVYTARARVAGAPVRSKGQRINAFRPAAASYYGPGLYGGGLACGGTLTPSKLGVAHKTLPCGSKVTLRYHGHTVTVPVIDRGPFAGNREYDLTEATKAKLGFPPVGTVLTTR
jgi:peptidoglycan lytic transglycosylase